MDVSLYDFDLPKSLIAQKPARPRDHARLLVYDRQSGTVREDYFYNLDHFLPPKSTLVLNDSKVEMCRLLICSAEIFITERIDTDTARALVRPGKKFRVGSKVVLDDIAIEVLTQSEDGQRVVRFDRSIDDHSLDRFRRTPFPPYIKADEHLASEYQTVFAATPGSMAAPTAGLHFTQDLLHNLARKHPLAKITLHVGLGTFGSLQESHLKENKLHSEHFEISMQTAQKLNKASHITAVGTTSCRALETIGRPFTVKAGQTDIFIRPGYEFRAVDALVTNFHLPKSSLLMLVAAFIGSVEELQRLYAIAIKNQYRFYSFGDAMLIL